MDIPDAFLAGFSARNPGARLERLLDEAPVWQLHWPTTRDFGPPGLEEAIDALVLAVGGPVALATALFRGCTPRSLPRVIATGVDVDPFFASYDPKKALEYGRWPKLLMWFDRRLLERSWAEVAADMAPQVLQELRAKFPVELTSTDGQSLWFSKFEDGRATIGYEAASGYALSAAGRAALLGCLLISRSEAESAEVRRLAALSSAKPLDGVSR